MNISMLSKKNQYIFLALCFFCACFFDLLFYNKERGISYFLFIITITGLFIWTLHILKRLKKDINWLLLLPIVILSLFHAIHWNPIFTPINYIVVPIILVTLSLLVSNKNRAKLNDIRFLTDVIEAFFYPYKYFSKPFNILNHLFRGKAKKEKRVIAVKIFIGFIISVPILSIVVSLLSDADKIFEYIISRIPELLKYLDMKNIVRHSFLIIFIFLYLFAYIWNITCKHKEDYTKQLESKNKLMVWDSTIILTILFMLNIVYLLFAFVQFSYLFGGSEFMVPSDFTYAEYARHGFFELVAVSVINFSLLSGTLFFVNKEETSYKFIKIFLSLTIVMTVIILISAYYRLLIYENAYGYTYSRLLVNFFLVLLLFLFIATLVNLWHKSFSLKKTSLILLTITYIFMNIINFESLIAKKNIDIFFETNKIDIQYLKTLKYDAVPELVRLLEAEDPLVSSEIDQYLTELLETIPEKTHWQSFNYSRYRAYNILKNL